MQLYQKMLVLVEPGTPEELVMNGIIYIIGLIVVVMVILSFFGLR